MESSRDDFAPKPYDEVSNNIFITSLVVTLEPVALTAVAPVNPKALTVATESGDEADTAQSPTMVVAGVACPCLTSLKGWRMGLVKETSRCLDAQSMVHQGAHEVSLT